MYLLLFLFNFVLSFDLIIWLFWLFFVIILLLLFIILLLLDLFL